MLFIQGCRSRYYSNSQITIHSIKNLNGSTIIKYTVKSETMYFCPGADIIDENETTITIRFLRDNINYNRIPKIKSQFEQTNGYSVQVENPQGKKIEIQ